jgi:predicted DNA-binding protein (MmcQ/YjbR family)
MTARQIENRLRKRALSYPGAYEDHPWGETAIKVKDKVFVFMGADGKKVSISVKLPSSRDMAHDLPFTEPTHYGLGKHGWVTAHLDPRSKPPLELMEAWIDESYRAVAPKRLVAGLAPARKA